MTTYPFPLIFRPVRRNITEGAPAREPVSVEEAKRHLEEDDAHNDALISSYIQTARELVEEMANRALLTQTRVLKLDRFPAFAEQLIQLPGGSLQAVSSITYLDTDGASQTWGAANYIVDTAHAPGRVGLAYQASWPTIREWDLPVTINYTVGYGDDAGDVPEKLRTAMLKIVAELYERREEMAPKVSIEQVPLSAKMLAYGERIPSFSF